MSWGNEIPAQSDIFFYFYLVSVKSLHLLLMNHRLKVKYWNSYDNIFPSLANWWRILSIILEFLIYFPLLFMGIVQRLLKWNTCDAHAMKCIRKKSKKREKMKWNRYGLQFDLLFSIYNWLIARSATVFRFLFIWY